MTRTTVTISLVSAAVLFVFALPAAAQTTVPQVTTGSSGYLFPNDQYQREREERNRRGGAAAETNAARSARECSADALPAPERRALEARFAQIDRTQGRDAAMAYAHEQGRIFRERLISEGVCSAQ